MIGMMPVIRGILLSALLAVLPCTVSAADKINWTFYAPGASGWMQGPMKAAYPDAGGSSNGIHTLDDVRTGKSTYVTLASASTMKGRWYCIGTVTYTSPRGNGGDGQTHTLENVIGYVHDTGCAFNGTCSCEKLPQYCSRQSRTDKMDIAVGNFSGYGAAEAMNHVTKNPNRAPASWQQIAGLPARGASGGPCGGEAKETGTPTKAPYDPNPTGGSTAGTPRIQASPTTIGTAAGTAAGTGVSPLASPLITTGNTVIPTTVSSAFVTTTATDTYAQGYSSTTATSTSILNLLNALSGGSASQATSSAATSVTRVTLDAATTESLWALSAQTGAEADTDDVRAPIPSVTQQSTFSSPDLGQGVVASSSAASDSVLWERVRSMLDQARSMLLDMLARLRAIQ